MDWSDRIAPEPRLALKRAVAWRTATEIVRHHPTLDLRLVETHPCDGGYDCLTLVRWPSFGELCSFNLPGTGLAIGEPIARERELPVRFREYAGSGVWRYPQHGLGEDRGALALAIEACLGFPPRAEGPPPTLPGLALGVVAELLDRVALGPRPVDVRNGWYATNGYGDAPVRPWALRLPVVAGLAAGAEWQEQRRAAIRYWSLDRAVASTAPAVVVDVATTAVWVRGEPRKSLAERFDAGHGIRSLAWSLEEALDGAA